MRPVGQGVQKFQPFGSAAVASACGGLGGDPNIFPKICLTNEVGGNNSKGPGKSYDLLTFKLSVEDYR